MTNKCLITEYEFQSTIDEQAFLFYLIMCSNQIMKMMIFLILKKTIRIPNI